MFTEFYKKKSLFGHWTTYKIRTTHVFGTDFYEDLLDLVDKHVNIKRERKIKDKATRNNDSMKPIDKVTPQLLCAALHVFNIHFDIDTLDKVIDIVELIEDNGGNVTLDELNALGRSWMGLNEPYPPKKK